MAMIGKAQSVIIGEMRYLYGQTVPYIKYTDTSDHTEHEIWDAKIVSVSGIRENSAGFDGIDNEGNPVSVSINMDNVIENKNR